MGKHKRMVKARYILCLSLFRQSSCMVEWTSDAAPSKRTSAVCTRTHRQAHKHNHIEPSEPVDLWKLLCSSDETSACGSFCYGSEVGTDYLKECHFFSVIETLTSSPGWLSSQCKTWVRIPVIFMFKLNSLWLFTPARLNPRSFQKKQQWH